MENLIQGLSSLGTPSSLAYLFAGAVIGLVAGAIPGLSLVVILSIILIFAEHIDLTGSLCLFLGAQCGGFYSASISAILFNTPAHPEAFPITFDGHPMARNGHPGRALGLSAASTCIGGFIGCGVLIGFLQIINYLPSVFLAPEYVGLVVLSMLLVGTLGSDSVGKTIVASGAGIALSSVGPSAITGVFRYTFGAVGLESGVSIVALALGMFAIPQMMMLFGTGTATTRQDMTGQEIEEINVADIPRSGYRKELLGGVAETFRQWRMVLQGGLVGGVTGIIPGIGGFTGNIMAYGIARQTSRNRRNFGTGAPEGIVAPEASSLAKEAGHVIPIVGLGIPGGIVGALFIGLFSIKGVNVGYGFQQANPGVTGTIVWVIALSGLIGTIIGVLIGPQIAKAATLPGPFLVPFIFAICISGIFLTDQLFFSVVEILVFAVAGMTFRRLRYPLGPLVLGLVLGPVFEQNVEHMRTLWPGLSFVGQRPIADVIFVLAFLTLAAKWFELRRAGKERKKELQGHLVAAGESADERRHAFEEYELKRAPYPLLSVVNDVALLAISLFLIIYGMLEYSAATRTLPVVGAFCVAVPSILFLPRDVLRYVRYRRLRSREGGVAEETAKSGLLPEEDLLAADMTEDTPAVTGGADVLQRRRARSLMRLRLPASTQYSSSEEAAAAAGSKPRRMMAPEKSWQRGGQYRREVLSFAWLCALVGFSYLFGFAAGAAVFMFGYCAISLRSYFKTLHWQAVFTVAATAGVWLLTTEMFNLTAVLFTPVF
jgi:putative tricarboxylic transport membrane protein